MLYGSVKVVNMQKLSVANAGVCINVWTKSIGLKFCLFYKGVLISVSIYFSISIH